MGEQWFSHVLFLLMKYQSPAGEPSLPHDAPSRAKQRARFPLLEGYEPAGS